MQEENQNSVPVQAFDGKQECFLTNVVQLYACAADCDKFEKEAIETMSMLTNHYFNRENLSVVNCGFICKCDGEKNSSLRHKYSGQKTNICIFDRQIIYRITK